MYTSQQNNTFIKNDKKEPVSKQIFILIPFIMFLIVSLFFLIGYINRIYDVWAEGMIGQAELARAESNRQIKTLEAKAQLESSKHLADSEIIRARGVAEANKIIGDSLKENEGYLRYLWIQGLQTNQMQVVYIPTEAGLPILESSRIK